MAKEYSLISTNLELNYDKNNNKILLGNWCLHNVKKIKKNHKIIDNLWSKKAIFIKDYIYIKGLVKRLSKSLAIYLNNIHKKKYSIRFWKILILPWLTIYLSAYYYRWKIILHATKKKQIKYINFFNIQSNNTPIDCYDFHSKVQNDNIFNYVIFRKIILYLKINKKLKIKITNSKNFTSFFNKNKKNYNKFLFYLKIKISFIINYFLSLNKIFIEKLAFRKIDNLKLNFLLKQTPTYPYDFFNNAFGFKNLYQDSNFDLKKRNKNLLIFSHKNEFEKFLKKSIIEDLPLCFVEGFVNLDNFAKKINIKPKKVISSYYCYFNEIFKVWIANLVERKKTKFYTVTHGGGGHLKYPSAMNFEEEVGDKKLVWFKSNLKSEVQLPASIFITKKKIFKQRNLICYVEGPIQLYPSRIGYHKIGNENSESFKFFLQFYKKINYKIRKKIIYLPKKEHQVNASENLGLYLNHNQIKEPNSFKKYNLETKLNILSYPQTSFCESIQSTPSILIYEKDKWEFQNQFKYIYNNLLRNKILFHSADKAAQHVNNISDNIDKWWLKTSVQKTINQYLNDMCLVSKNSVNIWVKKLKMLK